MPKSIKRTRKSDKRNPHNRRTLRKSVRELMLRKIDEGGARFNYGRGGTHWHYAKANIISGSWSQGSRYSKDEKKE